MKWTHERLLPYTGLMFERYTEQARRSIFFARYEASAAASGHIELAHLILGLLREDRSLAALVPDLESLRSELVTPAKIATSSSADLPLSMECKRALALGSEAAVQLGHFSISCVHLLLGVLRIEDSSTAKALRDRGVTEARIREMVNNTTAEETPPDRAKIHEAMDRLPDASLTLIGNLLRYLEGHGAQGKLPLPGLGAFACWNAGPSFEPSEGRYSSSRKEPDGATVVETRHTVRGHEIIVIERLRLSDDGKTLTYAHEIRGPGQQRQHHEFQFGVRPN